MHITITTLDDRIINIEVGEDLELENLKAQCEFELGIPSANIQLTWNGRPLHDDKMTMKDYGINHNDVLLLQQMRGQPSHPAPQASGSGMAAGGSLAQIDFSGIQIPGSTRPPPKPDLEDPLVILELIKNNPHERALLKERNPPLSDALESGNTERFLDVYRKQREQRLDKEREKMRLLQMDPFSAEAQKLIAEEIRLKNVESNMESAIEFVPESFGQVIMLYVDCKVNGHEVKAFVDSGAQMTIMSQACAERCNIMRLVDTRWAGIAKGVGTQNIIGRVHLGQIQIGNDFLQSSFSILENQPMDMLLGLDMLKRHQCVIDLQKNELVIGTTGTRTTFLPENQLPDHARINASSQEPESEDHQLAKALQKSAEEAAGVSNISTENNSISSTSSAPSTSQPMLTSTSTLQQQPAGASDSSLIQQPAGASDSTLIQQPTGASNNFAIQPQTPAGTPSSQGNAMSSVNSPFPESVIQQLVSLGYKRPDVIEALTNSGGDAEKASMALFAKFVSF